jgi:hypothetical protein
MAQNASQFSDYSLKPLVNHKWLLLHIFFTSGFPLAACEFLGGFYEAAYNSKFPKRLKGNLLVHHMQLKGSRL